MTTKPFFVATMPDSSTSLLSAIVQTFLPWTTGGAAAPEPLGVGDGAAHAVPNPAPSAAATTPRTTVIEEEARGIGPVSHVALGARLPLVISALCRQVGRQLGRECLVDSHVQRRALGDVGRAQHLVPAVQPGNQLT